MYTPVTGTSPGTPVLLKTFVVEAWRKVNPTPGQLHEWLESKLKFEAACNLPPSVREALHQYLNVALKDEQSRLLSEPPLRWLLASNRWLLERREVTAIDGFAAAKRAAKLLGVRDEEWMERGDTSVVMRVYEP